MVGDKQSIRSGAHAKFYEIAALMRLSRIGKHFFYLRYTLKTGFIIRFRFTTIR